VVVNEVDSGVGALFAHEGHLGAGGPVRHNVDARVELAALARALVGALGLLPARVLGGLGEELVQEELRVEGDPLLAALQQHVRLLAHHLERLARVGVLNVLELHCKIARVYSLKLRILPLLNELT